jgi:PAS domain S-box-containing protein
MLDQENYYFSIIDTIVVALDIEGKITFLNKKGYNILGYEEGELIGKNWFETSLPSYIKNEEYRIYKSLMKGENAIVRYFDNLIITKKGEEKIISWYNTVLKDVKGNILGTLSSGNDITERKKMEENIKKITRSFKMLSEANLLLSTADSELELFQKLCNTIVETGGYRLAWLGLVQHDEEKSVIPVAHAGFEEGYIESLNVKWANTERGQGPTGTCVRTKTYFIAKNILTDPRYLPWRETVNKHGGLISSISMPIMIENDVIATLSIYSVEDDIFDPEEVALLSDMATNLSLAIEKKRLLEQSQEEINKERDYLLNIFGAISDGIYIVNENEDMQFVNPILVKQFGSWEGKKCYSYFHNREGVCPWCKNQRVFAGETVHWEWYSAKNKKTYDLLDTLLINPDGTKSKLEVFRDITERKAIEQQKLYHEQLLKSSQFKSEFMAHMSHELRTPLNSIIGFTDVILERISGEINEEQDKYLTNVKSSALLLLDLINDILDIAKIESGKVELFIENVLLSQIIEQIKTMIKPIYEKKKLIFDIPEIANETIIRVDRLRFKEILFNILSNAVKYTQEGSVKLEISESEAFWTFSIIDTGIGIKEEDFELIFQDFKRVQSAYVVAIEGTGLGLSLTKRLIEHHGGNISFTSEFGKGSTFTFTIPKQSPGGEKL